MRKITSLFMLVIVALAWTSCEEENDGPKVVTKTDLLTAHTWKMTGFRIDPPIVIEGEDGTVEISDLFEILECWQDNTIKFSANGDNRSYIEDEGTNNCSEGDPTTSTGTWSFNSAETSITIDSENEAPETAVIEKLNETTFEISQEMTITDPEIGLNWTGKAYLTFSK